MSSTIITFKLQLRTVSIFAYLCQNFPTDFTPKYVENLHKSSIRRKRTQKFILLWCTKKPKMYDMEMQCSLGTIMLVYDWDRDHQLMLNPKPLTHYKMTSPLVMNFL